MKNINDEELQEFIKSATKKIMIDNSENFRDELLEDVSAGGKSNSEVLCTCVAKLYAQSYRAIGDVLIEVLSHLN